MKYLYTDTDGWGYVINLQMVLRNMSHISCDVLQSKDASFIYVNVCVWGGALQSQMSQVMDFLKTFMFSFIPPFQLIFLYNFFYLKKNPLTED